MVRVYGPRNVAPTEAASLMETSQVRAVPADAQAPVQPPKTESAAGVATR